MYNYMAHYRVSIPTGMIDLLTTNRKLYKTFKIVSFFKLKFLWSVPSYCLHHIWMIINKNKHTCERFTIEIDEREISQISP